jgi:endonuclease/exonuclease/phosphatase family metal-dependent hydrolase
VKLLVAVLVLVACGDPAAEAPDAAITYDSGPQYPPPRTDVVPSVGSDGSIDIATWNIENFPKAGNTAEHVANLIASLDLDLVALQEIEDTDAFNELVARLPEHGGVLSTHTYGNGTYQKLGFLYRRELLSVTGQKLLLTSYGYNLPRPPLQITVTVDSAGVDFTVIVVHLKAGFDTEDRERREAATVLLEDHVADQVAGAGDSDVIVLGDFNEIVTSAGGRAVLSPWLDAPSAYEVHTEDLANGGGFTFVPSQVILDHVVTTASLDDELAGGAVIIPRLDVQFLGYEQSVSDHLPVVVSMPAP